MLILCFINFLYAHTVTHSERPSFSALKRGIEIIYIETLKTLPSMCFMCTHLCHAHSHSRWSLFHLVEAGRGRRVETCKNKEMHWVGMH